MDQSVIKDIFNKIDNALELDPKDDDKDITEEDLLYGIADRVAYLLDTETGLLFSYLYRLDISEKELNAVFNTASDDPIAIRMAHLILDRQKQRIVSKQKYDSGPPIEGWEW